MPRALVLTLGTGRVREDIARALAEHTIPDHHPDRILVFATPESEAETLPLLLQFAPDYADVVQCIAHDINLTVDRLFDEYVRAIQGTFLSDGFKPEDLVADFTSGTKNMSAALVLAAVDLRIRSFSYVNGQRDATGRVIPGTETRQTIRPRSVHLSRHVSDFERLFDRADFAAAGAVIDSIRDAQLDAVDHERIDLLDRVASFYGAWDRYDLDAATAVEPPSDSKALTIHIPTGVADAFYRHSRKVVGLINTRPFHVFRLADLIENAERRFRAGAHDDAMLRLYRAMEYLAQYRLMEGFGIDTGDVALDRIPNALHAELEALRDDRGVIRIPMRRAYETLRALGDEIGAAFMTAYEDGAGNLQKLMNRRNASILAHGFDTIAPQDYRSLRDDHVLPLAGRIDGFADARAFVRFPRFRP